MSRLRSVFALLCAACLAVSLATPAAAQRTCGTAVPTQAELDQILGELNPNTLVNCSGTIVVAFHVLHNGAAGLLTQATVDAQIAEMNLNYAGYGYQFVLGVTTFTNNAAWFNLSNGADELAMTAALSVAPAQTLNIYSCIPYGYLGFSYFPSTFPENSTRHGVWIDYRSVPGGSFFPYNLGRTATHEAGHYLGLYHTFQGGCVAPGDLVADTPFESSPAFGCPLGRDTCPSAGVDPIHNYMDYTDDACYTEFTVGQKDLMCQMVTTYRPSLISGGPTPTRQDVWGSLKVRYR